MGKMSDWDDQAGAVVGVAQRGRRSSGDHPHFNARLPAPVLSSLKILISSSLVL